MDYENGTYDFILKKPIQVHVQGKGEEDFSTLVLREPAREHSKYAYKLKQMVTRSLKEIGDNNQPEDVNPEIGEIVEEKTPAQMLEDSEQMAEVLGIALELSNVVDLSDFVETFIKMAEKTAVKPIVLIDGQYVMKDAHTNQISLDDLQRMAVTYVSFFLTPSVMQGQ